MNTAPHLHIARVFAATPERVFHAWTDPQQLAVWMWGSMSRNGTAEVDLRVGGHYRIETDPPEGHAPDGTRWGMWGIYTEIVAQRRLVYSLRWDAPVVYNEGDKPVLDEIVLIDLAPAIEGCALEYHHLGIPGPEAIEAHRAGVNNTLDTLASLLQH